MNPEPIIAPNRRILVVDDNRAIHEDFRKILGEPPPASSALVDAAAELFGDVVPADPALGFEMHSAFQGHEAFEMARRARKEGRPYAVAFVDVRMPPGWDGIETVEEIWRADRETQIVICTAYSPHSWTDALARLGRPDRIFVLKKPFDNIEVLQLANALTEKWRLLRQTRERIAALEQALKSRSQIHCADGDRETAIAGLAARINPVRELSVDLATRFHDVEVALKPLLAAYNSLLVAAEAGTCDPSLLAYVRGARAAAPIDGLLEEIDSVSRQLVEQLRDIAEMVHSPTASPGLEPAAVSCTAAAIPENFSP